jgi:hypothetical protein
MKSMRGALATLGFSSLFLLSGGGCQYYCVTDADKGGRGYITHTWVSRHDGDNDTGMRFINLKTDEEVVLTSTKVEAIPFDEALSEIAAARTPRVAVATPGTRR